MFLCNCGECQGLKTSPLLWTLDYFQWAMINEQELRSKGLKYSTWVTHLYGHDHCRWLSPMLWIQKKLTFSAKITKKWSLLGVCSYVIFQMVSVHELWWAVGAFVPLIWIMFQNVDSLSVFQFEFFGTVWTFVQIIRMNIPFMDTNTLSGRKSLVTKLALI